MWNGRIFLIFSLISICEGFFSIDISKFNNGSISRLNLTCVYFDYTLINCDYCVYQYFTNGSFSYINYDCIQITNTYKILSTECNGFSNSKDIGYGICSPPSFDFSDISILCICATNMCNANFTECQSSVNNQIETNTVPSVLPLIIPNLSKTISCIDTLYSLEQYSLNVSDYCFNYPSPFINLTKCDQYVLDNTVLCYYSSYDDNPTTLSLTKDSYLMYLVGIINLMNELSPDPNMTQYYNQTSSYFYIQWDSMNDTEIVSRCLCAQDNCDANLTTCLNSNQSIINSATKNLNGIFLDLIIKFLLIFLYQTCF